MSTYNPDKWLLIEIRDTIEDAPEYKIFAVWSGGYISGNSWKLNSGVVDYIEGDTAYYFNGYSGSTYVCRKTGYGSNGYGWSVVSNMVKEVTDKYGEGLFKIIDEKNIEEILKNMKKAVDIISD